MKQLLWILVFLWMLVIFSFSNQTGSSSTSTSNTFAKPVMEVVDILKLPLEKETVTFLVRKCAHMMEYAILGILTYLAFRQSGYSKTWIYAILLCLIYASFDETHQLFLIGRSGEIKDVLIDMIGACMGIFPIHLIVRKK